jgi:hypothetical protein
MFSGLNLAIFGIGRLRLEVETSSGNKDARKVLGLREEFNLTLTTILWGNVGVNVLLALLSNSVLIGVAAFFFSTVVITLVGEILPQAYFSRHALRVAALFATVIKFYRFVLYPMARPTALFLDRWLGKEGIEYFRERGLREIIKKHIEAEESDIDRLEGLGAMNFLAIDDLAVAKEGRPLDPLSVISLPVEDGRPVFPCCGRDPTDPFLRKVHASGKRWVTITGPDNEPLLVLDADGFLRDTFLGEGDVHPLSYCHRPIVVRDGKTHLGEIMRQLRVHTERSDDDIVDYDIILLWSDLKQVITDSDLLNRLMRGITTQDQ